MRECWWWGGGHNAYSLCAWLFRTQWGGLAPVQGKVGHDASTPLARPMHCDMHACPCSTVGSCVHNRHAVPVPLPGELRTAGRGCCNPPVLPQATWVTIGGSRYGEPAVQPGNAFGEVMVMMANSVRGRQHKGVTGSVPPLPPHYARLNHHQPKKERPPGGRDPASMSPHSPQGLWDAASQERQRQWKGGLAAGCSRPLCTSFRDSAGLPLPGQRTHQQPTAPLRHDTHTHTRAPPRATHARPCPPHALSNQEACPVRGTPDRSGGGSPSARGLRPFCVRIIVSKQNSKV